MASSPVERLLRFSSVAVIGASQDERKIGGRPIALLRKFGFQGSIYGVNPKYTTVQGEPCVAHPLDLPPDLDLAIFAVPAPSVIDALPAICDKGIKTAVVLSSGFAESGVEGQRLQRRLQGIARHRGLVLNGPNCSGIASFTYGTCATFANAFATLPLEAPGAVALVSQSAGFASNIYADALLAGVRFSHFITTGNEACLTFADYLEFLAEDPATKMVIAYIEGLTDGRRFIRAVAKMQATGKPFVVLKVGRSAAGTVAVRTHTGLMSGNDESYQAVFQRYGVIRARSLEELTDYARVFSLQKLDPKITIVTTSGGAAVYTADACSELGISLSRLSAATSGNLAGILPDFAVTTNPIDLTAQVVNQPSLLETSLDILCRDPELGALLFILIGQGESERAKRVIEILERVKDATNKELVLAWLGVPEQIRLSATSAGLAVFSDPIRFLRPFSKLMPHADFGRRAAHNVRLHATQRTLDSRSLVGEWDSLQLVEAYGISTPRRWRVASAKEIRAIADDLRFPCVLKLLVPVVAHRARLGAVFTNLRSEAALLKAWEVLVKTHAATMALLAEQVDPGLELLVGAVADPIFGLRTVVGAGGTGADYWHDTVTMVPPLNARYVAASLQRLRCWPLLERRERQTIRELVRVVRAVAQICKREHLREFECNPVIVTAQGTVAVDALGLFDLSLTGSKRAHPGKRSARQSSGNLVPSGPITRRIRSKRNAET